MAPSKFGDIGKSSSDLLSKDYPVGVTKLEVKTNTPNGISFIVNGTQDAKSGGINGELKTKFADKARGLTVTETWTTSNVVGAEVELADSLLKGLKLNLNGSFVVGSGQKNTKLGVEYKQEYLFSNASLDVFKGPTASADVAVGAEGFVAGAEVAYNIQDGKVSKYAAALGYSKSDYAVSLHALSNFSSFSASYYHRVNESVEAGAKAVYDKKNASTVALELGTKYVFDADAFAKAKINNVGVLGLGFTQTVRPGVKVSLGGSIDTARLQENAHKFGLSLALEA